MVVCVSSFSSEWIEYCLKTQTALLKQIQQDEWWCALCAHNNWKQFFFCRLNLLSKSSHYKYFAVYWMVSGYMMKRWKNGKSVMKIICIVMQCSFAYDFGRLCVSWISFICRNKITILTITHVYKYDAAT